MPNPLEDLLAQLSGGGQQPPQPPPDEAPQINPAPDMKAVADAAPDQPDTSNIGQRPPGEAELYRKKLEATLSAKQQEWTHIDKENRNGAQRLIQSTLGDQDTFAKKQVAEKYGGKMGTAKAILVDFLAGVAHRPSDVKESIKQSANDDYDKAAKNVIEQQKIEHQQMSEQLNLAKQNEQAEKNDDTAKNHSEIVRLGLAKLAADKENKGLLAEMKKSQLDLAKTKEDHLEKGRQITQKLTEERIKTMVDMRGVSKWGTEAATKSAVAAGLTPGTPEFDDHTMQYLKRYKDATYRANAKTAPTGYSSPELESFRSALSRGAVKISEIPQKLRGAVLSGMDPEAVPVPLSEGAKSLISESDKILDQIRGIKEKIANVKDNDTPLYYAKDVGKYKMGMAGANDTGGLIADLSLNSVVGAARILKSSSKARETFERALEHTPSAWKDSPKLISQKLDNIERNLLDGKAYAMEEWTKNTAANQYQNPRADPKTNTTSKLPAGKVAPKAGGRRLVMDKNGKVTEVTQ